MGRPRKYNDKRVATTVMLSTALRDRLIVASERRMVGRNLIIARAIEEWLDRNEHDPVVPEGDA